MKEYNEALYKIDISGNELNESELIILFNNWNENRRSKRRRKERIRKTVPEY